MSKWIQQRISIFKGSCNQLFLRRGEDIVPSGKAERFRFRGLPLDTWQDAEYVRWPRWTQKREGLDQERFLHISQVHLYLWHRALLIVSPKRCRGASKCRHRCQLCVRPERLHNFFFCTTVTDCCDFPWQPARQGEHLQWTTWKGIYHNIIHAGDFLSHLIS